MMTVPANNLEHSNKNVASLLFILLIASLPFFSLRGGSLGLSAPLVIIAIIMIAACFRLIVNLKVRLLFSGFDFLVCAYLLIAFFSFIYATDDSSVLFSFLKSVFYFAFYLALKVLLNSSSSDNIEKALLSGVVLGTSLFVLFSFYALLKQGVLSGLINDFSYYGVTFKVFSVFFELLGVEGGIKSADIMRNAIGEVFAFYFIVIYFSKTRSIWTKVAYIAFNFILVISMFSRRAFLAMMATIITAPFRGKNKLLLFGFVFIGTIGLFVIVSSGGIVLGGRLMDFSDTSRLTQYIEAIELFSQNPLLGKGFGFKLGGEKYIHNFVLSSSVMMGVAGLFISMCIFFLVIFNFLEGVIGRSKTLYSYLLIIPILGMTVGSTVEGIFTPISWIALAVYEVHKCKKSLIEPANKALVRTDEI